MLCYEWLTSNIGLDILLWALDRKQITPRRLHLTVPKAGLHGFSLFTPLDVVKSVCQRTEDLTIEPANWNVFPSPVQDIDTEITFTTDNFPMLSKLETCDSGAERTLLSELPAASQLAPLKSLKLQQEWWSCWYPTVSVPVDALCTLLERLGPSLDHFTVENGGCINWAKIVETLSRSCTLKSLKIVEENPWGSYQKRPETVREVLAQLDLPSRALQRSAQDVYLEVEYATKGKWSLGELEDGI